MIEETPRQPTKRQKTALEKRAQALLDALNDVIAQLEDQWKPGNHTVFEVLYEYKPQAKRLSKRLEGWNPRTLRRRLSALKRDLSKKAGYEASRCNTPYDPSWSISPSKWEQMQLDAALRYAALNNLVNGLEKVIRPGLEGPGFQGATDLSRAPASGQGGATHFSIPGVVSSESAQDACRTQKGEANHGKAEETDHSTDD